MKAEIDGWSYYDPRSVERARSKYPHANVIDDVKEAWRISSLGPTEGGYPITPLHALSLGWKILVPPEERGHLQKTYTWWFVRDL